MAIFTIYRTPHGLYTFSLRANNGEVLLNGERYHSKVSCHNGVESVRTNGRDERRYDRYMTSNGKYCFSLKAGNGQIIGSSELYETVEERDDAIAAVQSIAADAGVKDGTEQDLTNWVKEKRRQLGLTQQQLAEKAGVGLRFLRELEQGKSTLRIDKVNQVLELFGHELGPVLTNRNNLRHAES